MNIADLLAFLCVENSALCNLFLIPMLLSAGFTIVLNACLTKHRAPLARGARLPT